MGMGDYEYADDGLYKYDREEAIDSITDLFQSNPEVHGFVNRPTVESWYSSENIKYLRRHSEIVTVVSYNHGERKPITTVYQLAAKGEYKELREELLHRVLKASPHNKLRTKVPAGVNQNDFWKEHGQLLRTTGGKRRNLNIYEVSGGRETEDSKSIMEFV